MSSLKFKSKVAKMGDLSLSQVGTFTFEVEDGKIGGILPGCPCTTAQVSLDGKTITGETNVLSAAGQEHPGGLVSKIFYAAENDDTPVYSPDDNGVYRINPEKTLIPLTVRFNLVKNEDDAIIVTDEG